MNQSSPVSAREVFAYQLARRGYDPKLGMTKDALDAFDAAMGFAVAQTQKASPCILCGEAGHTTLVCPTGTAVPITDEMVKRAVVAMETRAAIDDPVTMDEIARVGLKAALSDTSTDSHPLYSATIAWSGEDQAYIGTIPELPGCCADGATPEECIRELKDAKAAWIEACKTAGNPIPAPRPFSLSDSSPDREDK